MKKVKLMMLCIVLVLSLFEISSFASDYTFKFKCTRGTDGYYYRDSSISAYANHIDDAKWNWEHTGYGENDVWLTRKTNTSGTIVDFYGVSQAYFGINAHLIVAITEPRNGSGTLIDPNKSDWLYSEIKVNLDKIAQINDQQVQGTMAHEIGHAFGLAHRNDNPYSIMCQLGSGRIVYQVQKIDQDTVTAKYSK